MSIWILRINLISDQVLLSITNYNICSHSVSQGNSKCWIPTYCKSRILHTHTHVEAAHSHRSSERTQGVIHMFFVLRNRDLGFKCRVMFDLHSFGDGRPPDISPKSI